jgi:hypothetical protein
LGYRRRRRRRGDRRHFDKLASFHSSAFRRSVWSSRVAKVNWQCSMFVRCRRTLQHFSCSCIPKLRYRTRLFTKKSRTSQILVVHGNRRNALRALEKPTAMSFVLFHGYPPNGLTVLVNGRKTGLSYVRLLAAAKRTMP